MAIKYYELINNKKIDINNSLSINISPKYILPSGNIYFDSTDHYNANFIVDINDIKRYKDSNDLIEYYNNGKMNYKHYIINEDYVLFEEEEFKINPDLYYFLCKHHKKKLKIASDMDSIKLYNKDCIHVSVNYNNRKDYLNREYKSLLDTYYRIKKYGVSLNDQHRYLNYNAVSFGAINPFIEEYGYYNNNDKMIVLGLIEAKLEVYKYYINHKDEKYDDVKDFIFYNLGFDKIESALPRTITTNRLKVNEEYYNYLLMNYNIVRLNNYTSIKEMEIEEEIKQIKKSIPFKERYRFFK